MLLFARPLESSLRWHVKDHLGATGAYRLTLLSDEAQRVAALARLPALEPFESSFRPCEAMRRQPAGLQLLLSQAELRQSGRLQSNVPEGSLKLFVEGRRQRIQWRCVYIDTLYTFGYMFGILYTRSILKVHLFIV